MALQNLSDRATLLMDIVRSEYEDSMKEKLNSKHHGKIWHGSNGKWFTYIESQDNGRKLIVRKTKSELEEFLLGHYKIAEDAKEFGALFEAWNDRRLKLKQIAPSTHMRNKVDYKKYFMVSLGKVKVHKASPFEYVSALEQNVSEFDMDAKSLNRIITILKGTLNYARRLGYIEYTGNSVIEEYRSLGIKLRKPHKEDYEEVFTDEEMQKVMAYLEQNPCDVNNAIYLLFITGLRVGECVALKHSDFDGNAISIRRTETSWREEGFLFREVKDSPKTAAGYRTVVVPTAYDWFLDVLRKQNPFKEWLFYGTDGRRLSDNYVQRRLKQICLKLDIYPKSPHKIRKTYCSILLDNKIDSEFVKQQVGHTDIWCTEHFYHRNRRDLEQKTQIINTIPEFGINQTSINHIKDTKIR